MASPFVIDTDRLCTEKKCEPFFIREWETMLVGTLICAALIYMICCARGERFGAQRNRVTYDRRASAQARHVVDDRPGISRFAAVRAPVVQGALNQGLKWPSSGPSIDRFMDFEAIDAIDNMSKGEPLPTHQPETADDKLEQMIR